MYFEEFVQEVSETIADYLFECDIEDVCIERIVKNNGVELTGLVIKERGNTIYPNIYLESYFELYNNGYSMDKIVRQLADAYMGARNKMDVIAVTDVIDGNVDDTIFLQLVNYEKNEELLKDCPHVRYMDLAFIYRLLVKSDSAGVASAVITNSMMKHWCLDGEELHEKALTNTRRLFTPLLEELGVAMERVYNVELPLSDTGLFVLTNNKFLNGAANIIYDDILQDFAERIGEGFYILPSSIHEVILVPEGNCDMDKGALMELVRDVNQNILKDTEFLSENVYYYDKNLHLINI